MASAGLVEGEDPRRQGNTYIYIYIYICLGVVCVFGAHVYVFATII